MSYGLHIDRNNVSNSVVDAFHMLLRRSSICVHMGLTSTAGFAPRVYTTLRVSEYSDALRLFAYDDALFSRNVVMCILYEEMVEYLCAHEADVNRGLCSSSLHYAACFERPQIVRVCRRLALVQCCTKGSGTSTKDKGTGTPGITGLYLWHDSGCLRGRGEELTFQLQVSPF